MDDKLLERFSVGRKAEPHLAPFAGPEESEMQDFGFFGILRGRTERAVMLELRQRDGNIKAIGYAWLERAEFDPSEGIRLFAAGWEITIAGRNLNQEVRPNVRLFESLVRHRVSWVREGDEGELIQAPDAVLVIESITWKLCTPRSR